MAYIERNEKGEITAVFETKQENAKEFLSLDSTELVDYLTQAASGDDARKVLSTSDIALIRVLEDLINTLIDKKVILFTDLPIAAREKLSSREKIRGHLNSLENLMGDDEGLL